MARRQSKDIENSIEVDLTPMIDMVFQLIIFFIVVIDFTQKDLEDLNPPSVRYGAVEDKPDPERLLINVTRNTEIVVKGDTQFLPQPAKINLTRTRNGARKLRRLEKRIREQSGMERLEDLETPKRLIERIRDYALEMERLDERDNRKPTDEDARIQYLDVGTASTASGQTTKPIKVVDIPLLIRADRYTPFYAVNDVLTLCLPSADPNYMNQDPTKRDPPFPFRRVEFSTKLDEEEAARRAAAEGN